MENSKQVAGKAVNTVIIWRTKINGVKTDIVNENRKQAQNQYSSRTSTRHEQTCFSF